MSFARAAACFSLLTLALSVVFPARATDDSVLFELEGTRYSVHELPASFRDVLYKQELRHFLEREELLKEMVYSLILDGRARQDGVSRSEAAERLLGPIAPTAIEIEEHYNNSRDRFTGTLEAERDAVTAELRSKRIRARKHAIVASSLEDGAARMHLAEPAPPPVDIDIRGAPARGPADAAITIIEFGDYQCPLCRQAHTILNAALEAEPSLLRLVYLDFPINRSGIARRIAQGAHCAQAQGQFWAYHDRAFEFQDSLAMETPGIFAGELGLDLARFGSCLAAPETRQSVEQEKQLGKRLGVQRTPTVFVNGRPFPFEQLARNLQRYVDAWKIQRGGGS